MADNTRRPEDDDETPVDPPTGEGEVVGADWLASQIDAAPTGQFDTRAAPAGADRGPGKAGDNPVLAWWRDKLVAADALVNPEPRSDLDDRGTTSVPSETTDTPSQAPVAPERPRDPVAPERPRAAETEPAAEEALQDAPEAAFLPEPAFTPARTPLSRGDGDADFDDDADDNDLADDDFTDNDFTGNDFTGNDAETTRAWAFGSDLDRAAKPAPLPEDEAETGVIPPVAPPLFQPKSARDRLAEESAPSGLSVPAGSQTERSDKPDVVLPTPAFTPPVRADVEPEQNAEPAQDPESSQNKAPVAGAVPRSGNEPEYDTPEYDSPEYDTQKYATPEYVTEDLDNFSWKLTANDYLDPRVHRRDSDGPGGIPAAAVPAGAASKFPAGDVDDDDAPTRRQSRIDDQAAPEPVLLPGPDTPGPRRRTFAAPTGESASTGTSFVTAPGPSKPPRKPLRAARPAAARAPRPVMLAAIGVVALLVLGGLFFLGSQLPGLLAGPAPTPSASSAPTTEPTPTTPPAPAGPAAPGEQTWTALGGGECVEPYSTPWAETFTVVDCGEPHSAQMVFTGPVAEDQEAAYPGEDAILAQISQWCSAPGVLDADAASEYEDLQVQGTYPVSEEQWAGGQRNYYCFVSRSSGEPLTGTVAAPSE